MNRYRYAVCLRVRHPSMDPAKIAAEFGLSPERAWQAGAPRTTPKGGTLEGRNRETYWTSGDLTSGTWPGRPLSDAVNGLLDQLATHKGFFSSVRNTGGRAELFVGWYFEGNSGDIFDYQTMGRLAELSLDLSLDYYPPDQPQADI